MDHFSPMRVLSWKLAFLFISLHALQFWISGTVAADEVNLKGSGLCKYHKGAMKRIHDALTAVQNPDQTYMSLSGASIACDRIDNMPGSIGVCAWFTDTRGAAISITETLGYLQTLINYGGGNADKEACGSVSIHDPDFALGGYLTLNYVSQDDCKGYCGYGEFGPNLSNDKYPNNVVDSMTNHHPLHATDPDASSAGHSLVHISWFPPTNKAHSTNYTFDAYIRNDQGKITNTMHNMTAAPGAEVVLKTGLAKPLGVTFPVSQSDAVSFAYPAGSSAHWDTNSAWDISNSQCVSIGSDDTPHPVAPLLDNNYLAISCWFNSNPQAANQTQADPGQNSGGQRRRV